MNSFDGIMTAVYDGWVLMLKGNKVKIYPGDDYAYELFCENINCKTNVKKAISVAQAFSRRYRLKHMNMFSGQHIIMIRIAGMLFWNSLKWDLEQVVELLRCLVKIE